MEGRCAELVSGGGGLGGAVSTSSRLVTAVVLHAWLRLHHQLVAGLVRAVGRDGACHG